MRKWDAGEEAMKERGEGNEVIAVVEPSEMTGGHRRSTDNHYNLKHWRGVWNSKY